MYICIFLFSFSKKLSAAGISAIKRTISIGKILGTSYSRVKERSKIKKS